MSYYTYNRNSLYHELKRIHIQLSDELHMAAKLFSTYQGLTLNSLFAQAIAEYLNNQDAVGLNESLRSELRRLIEEDLK